jgi:hypothetical protein
MIHIEISNVGTFKFLKNEIYLGRKALDLSLEDLGMKDNHLLLEVPEADLLVHPQKDVDHFLLNGKRSTSIRKLKVGDTVLAGNTQIKILGFERTEYPSKKEVLDRKLGELIDANSNRLPVIEKLSKMMK